MDTRNFNTPETFDSLFNQLSELKKNGVTSFDDLKTSSGYLPLWETVIKASSSVITRPFSASNAATYGLEKEDIINDFTIHMVEKIGTILNKIDQSDSTLIDSSMKLHGYVNQMAKFFIYSKMRTNKSVNEEISILSPINNDGDSKETFEDILTDPIAVLIEDQVCLANLVKEVFDTLLMKRKPEIAILTLALDFTNSRKKYIHDIEGETSPDKIIKISNYYIDLALSEFITDTSKYYVGYEIVNKVLGKSRKQLSTLMSNVVSSNKTCLASSAIYS